MAGKKKMVAELNVDPKSEFNKASKAWVASNSNLKKLFSKNIKYEHDLELDDGKWNEKKLSKALEGLVRYELKYLASGVANTLKDVEKSPDKLKKAVDKDMPGLLADVEKLVRKKCKAALEELATSGGDDKKAAKEGLDVFKDLNSMALDALFRKPKEDTLAAFATLHKELVKSEAMEKDAKEEENDKKRKAMDMAAEKRRDGAFNRAARSVDQAKKAYDRSQKEVESGLAALLKYAQKTLKQSDKKGYPEFGAYVEKKVPEIRKLNDKMDKFGEALDEAYRDIASRKSKSVDAADKSKDFERRIKDSEGAAADARKKLSALADQFKRL